MTRQANNTALLIDSRAQSHPEKGAVVILLMMMISSPQNMAVAAAVMAVLLYAEWILISKVGRGRLLLGALPSGRQERTQRPHPQAETTTTTPPLRNQTGTWIGNNWVPPRDWHLFSAIEMLQLYHDKSVLWVGDSTSRRAALTLYGILQAPSDAIPACQMRRIALLVPLKLANLLLSLRLAGPMEHT